MAAQLTSEAAVWDSDAAPCSSSTLSTTHSTSLPEAQLERVLVDRQHRAGVLLAAPVGPHRHQRHRPLQQIAHRDGGLARLPAEGEAAQLLQAAHVAGAPTGADIDGGLHLGAGQHHRQLAHQLAVRFQRRRHALVDRRLDLGRNQIVHHPARPVPQQRRDARPVDDLVHQQVDHHVAHRSLGADGARQIPQPIGVVHAGPRQRPGGGGLPSGAATSVSTPPSSGTRASVRRPLSPASEAAVASAASPLTPPSFPTALFPPPPQPHTARHKPSHAIFVCTLSLRFVCLSSSNARAGPGRGGPPPTPR